MAGGAAGPFPYFWRQPLRYIRWAAHEKPALLWSIVIGVSGPAIMVVVPPIRQRMGYERRVPIPMTYPVPTGPRKNLPDYDD